METQFSILDKKECPHTDEATAVFFTDLNLNQIIDRATAQWRGGIKDFYHYFPLDEECEAYRRDVYADVKREPVYLTLRDFVESAKEMESCRKQKDAVVSPMQRCVWHIREMDGYCRVFENLGENLEALSTDSEGMREFKRLLQQYLHMPKYQEMRQQVREILESLSQIRFLITYEKDRIAVAEGTASGDYEIFLAKYRAPDAKNFRNPFQVNPCLVDLERECLDILIRKNQKLFQRIQNCARDYENYAEEFLLRFLREIPFYLSFCSFENEMKDKGFCFAAPTVDKERKMEAAGLYDLALACAAVRENRKVVSNSMEYGENESFFVLTGPNQGGKTTFARSLGQLVYFSKMGLDVPARSANVHYFKDILTHFSVEESVETGRGKLKEELMRLAPMMEENCGNAFVVINELFTTAATYDAEIMGRKVLEHFIGQGCLGIYVTHLKELAGVHPKIVSLRAMLSEERIQSFRIERSEASESACAVNQVNKYRLTYEQLKERL